jgi:beta-glucosidase
MANGGMDYGASDVSTSTFRGQVLHPFERAVREGTDSVMPGFHSNDGVPCTADKDLLRGTLRRELGGEDVVLVSDYTAGPELIHHGVAKDRRHAAQLMLEAGVDIDMEGGLYLEHLPDLVADNKAQRAAASPHQRKLLPNYEEMVDQAARRILRFKLKLGVFESPYADPALAEKITLSWDHRSTVREAAERSMVLLKNDAPPASSRPVLPLSGHEKLAVIGPLAARADLVGFHRASARDEETVTILDGIRARANDDQSVVFAQGCRPNGPDANALEEAIRAAEKSDVVIAVVGETKEMSGEARTLADPELPAAQRELLQAVHERTGKPIVVVLANGRPLTQLGWIKDHAPAVLEAWQCGTMGGEAVANVLFGSDKNGRAVNPGGKLPTEILPSIGWTGSAHHDRKASGRPANTPDANGAFSTNFAYYDPDGELLPNDPRHKLHEPLWSFGFGLSYTTFEVGAAQVPPKVDLSALKKRGITVETTVSNTGDRAGDQVVQLYVRDLVASQVQPLKKMIGFLRVPLEPGETRKVAFQISAKDLEFFDRKGKRVLEPGEFKVWVGSSSRDEDLKSATFELVDEKGKNGARWWESAVARDK